MITIGVDPFEGLLATHSGCFVMSVHRESIAFSRKLD
jgi:hypothetical protein